MRLLTALSLFLVVPVAAWSQYDLGVHFMRGVWQANYTNPALLPDQQVIVALPGFQNQFSLENITYNELIQEQTDGSKILDIDGIIDQLEDDNFLRNELDIPTFALALRIGDGALVQLGHRVRANIATNYSRDLIALVWRGNAPFIGQEVSVGPDLMTQAYHEFFVGGALTLSDFVTLGARVKVLNGFAAAETSRSDLRLFTSDDVYQATLTADYQLNNSGLISIDDNGEDLNVEDIESLRDLFTSNFGLGVDLGASAQLGPLDLRLSVLDLGRINWNHNPENQILQGTFQYDGIDVNQPNLDSLDLGNIVDSLDAYFDFTSTNARFNTATPTRIFLSGTYRITESFQIGGLLYGGLFRGQVFPALAVSAQWDLAPFFSLGGLYSASRNGIANLGAHTAIRLGPVQVVAATDNLLTAFRPGDSSAAHFRLGLNLAFGRVESDKPSGKWNQEDTFFR